MTVQAGCGGAWCAVRQCEIRSQAGRSNVPRFRTGWSGGAKGEGQASGVETCTSQTDQREDGVSFIAKGRGAWVVASLVHRTNVVSIRRRRVQAGSGSGQAAAKGHLQGSSSVGMSGLLFFALSPMTNGVESAVGEEMLLFLSLVVCRQK